MVILHNLTTTQSVYEFEINLSHTYWDSAFIAYHKKQKLQNVAHYNAIHYSTARMQNLKVARHSTFLCHPTYSQQKNSRLIIVTRHTLCEHHTEIWHNVSFCHSQERESGNFHTLNLTHYCCNFKIKTEQPVTT